jgi:hypothetical protein
MQAFGPGLFGGLLHHLFLSFRVETLIVTNGNC